LNDGAKGYKETGRLKDAAQRVADAVRQEVERNGLAGRGDGVSKRNAEPPRPSAKAPDPLEGFSDPVNGEGVRAQIANTRIEPAAEPSSARTSDGDMSDQVDPNDPSRFDLFDAVPVARGFDDEGNEIAVVKSRADLAAELDADDEAVAVLDLCVKG